MVKRLTAALLICLMLCVALPFFAQAQEQRVFDYAHLFTDEEIVEFEARIAELRETYDMDFVLLTSDEATYGETEYEYSKYSMQFADDFYDQNGFGHGEENDGFLYFIDMSNRVPTVSTCGKAIRVFTDERIDDILGDATNTLRYSTYAASVREMFDNYAYYAKRGIPEGQANIDEHGNIISDVFKKLEIREIAIAGIVGLVVAFIFGGTINSKYKLKMSTYHYAVAENTTVNITAANDAYVTTHITRTPRSTDSGGGGGGGGGGGFSSTHSSGGGISHGGGSGGRF